jgi:hypothetical protein
MTRLRFVYATLLLVIFVFGSAFAAHGQDVAESHAHHQEQALPEAHPHGSAGESDMMEHCQQMMAQRKEILQRIEASDNKLADLLVQLNKAKGNRRIDALVKIVNELAAERKQLREALIAPEPVGTGASHMMGGMHGMTHGADAAHDKVH